MQILPTWDLFIIVFFAIIVAYSFIVGRNSTLKIIIGTYIAILTADGFGNLLDKFFLNDQRLINVVSLSSPTSIIVIKILIFVFAILLLTVRGSFSVTMDRERSMLITLATTATFGFLSAGLIISTILVYISGGSFVSATTSTIGMDVTTSSTLARLMTENYNIWFSLPALAFVIASFVSSESRTIPPEAIE